ncbi:hypothetical protein ACS0TY_027477 [Phlomoides rotata]
MPCTHALSTILHQKLQPEDFVDECYNRHIYKNVYEQVIMPISGVNEWAPTLFIPTMPPSLGRKAGRLTNVRRSGDDELQGKSNKKGRHVSLKRMQTNLKCKKCGKLGHNVRPCTQVEGETKPIERKPMKENGQAQTGEQMEAPRRQ